MASLVNIWPSVPSTVIFCGVKHFLSYFGVDEFSVFIRVQRDRRAWNSGMEQRNVGKCSELQSCYFIHLHRETQSYICMRAINKFEKLLKMCLDIDLKILFSNHWVSHAKNYVHEVKISIKSSKIVKNGPSNRKTVSSSALRSGGSIVQC